jgi:hypothetical protein
MEAYIEGLVGLLRPPLNYLAGVVAVLLLNADKLIALRDRWQSSHADMRRLEHEKLQLEVMLLRQQLMEARKQEYVPQIPLDVAVDPGSIRLGPRSQAADDIVVAPTPAPASASAGAVRRFVRGYPRLGWWLMLLAQVILGALTGFLALGTVGIVIVGFEDPELGVGAALFLAAVYGAFTWLAYRGFRAAGSIRTAA